MAGLGAMGSAAARELARRGHRVIGLDRFDPPHDRGSSHGRTRIIREAYFEAPFYVPVVRRAFECWAELEAETGATLLRRTGGLNVGPPDGALVAGARESAVANGLPYEELGAGELRRRFPGLRLPEDAIGLFDPGAGILDPERAVAASLRSAAAYGAELRTGEPVTTWRAGPAGIEVTTPRGRYRAGRLVLATGAWIGSLVPELGARLQVERNVVGWFRGARSAERLGPDRLPLFLGEERDGRLWYGFPDLGDGVKVAFHGSGVRTRPDDVERAVTRADVEPLATLVRRILPDVDPEPVATSVCLYTLTPDRHFVIDTHPAHESVVVVSACSGHGFKFASVVGEIVADLMERGGSRFDLEAFRLARLM